MSCDYAKGLSSYVNKGKCGLPEKFDDEETVETKAKMVADMIKNAKHVVVHTGAGISTAAGIPDFRGPKGVWTLEQKGAAPGISLSFNDTVPTVTHMALVAMQEAGFVKYLISQNIDGLHLKSGFPRSKLSELHGNMFIEECDQCKRQFVRDTCVTTVGQKCLDKPCPIPKKGGRTCRGKLYDNILDWDAELPFDDLQEADNHSKMADLNICLGSTLQIIPSGKLPIANKANGGKLVICNLQPTKYDNLADLIVNTYIDAMMLQIVKLLGIEIEQYVQESDPTRMKLIKTEQIFEWTLRKWQPIAKSTRKLPCKDRKAKKLKKEA
uniref:protein acetyllysine N-acetyltransferase n=1 Tax=Strigamia maritima TaxID=126957 RepID=T1JDX6_STRMM